MLQWVWPVPLAIGAFLAPESPWNAIRRGNYAQARKSLLRLRAHGDNEEVSVDNTMAYMVHVTRLEQAETAGAGYAECFKGTNLRRTEIVSARAKSSGFDISSILPLELRRMGCTNSMRQCHSRIRRHLFAKGRVRSHGVL